MLVKKLFAYLFLLIGTAALVTAPAVPIMSKIWKWNSEHGMNDKWYGKHNSGWGDLANMAYLDCVPEFQEGYTYDFKHPENDSVKNIALYLIGDSYTELVPGFAFAHTHSFQYSHNSKQFKYTLDTSKKNVLLIEITERFVINLLRGRDFFDTSAQNSSLSKGGDGKKNFGAIMNKNLEYLLLDYNLFNDVKFAKAKFNYRVFGRASGDVALSENKKYLFFKPTVSRQGIFSSYAPVADTQINYLVSTLNYIHSFYQDQGFEEVILTIIPSPASILQPANYNQMIPRLQERSDLEMPFVDLYSIFSNAQQPERMYRVGDTHWNNKGMQLWLGLINDRLSVISSR